MDCKNKTNVIKIKKKQIVMCEELFFGSYTKIKKY